MCEAAHTALCKFRTMCKKDSAAHIQKSPVRPAKFLMVVNAKAAKTIGLPGADPHRQLLEDEGSPRWWVDRLVRQRSTISARRPCHA